MDDDLAGASDPRADDWLIRARTALTAQADTITGVALRRCFLCNIRFHRETVAAWARRNAFGDEAAAEPAVLTSASSPDSDPHRGKGAGCASDASP